MAEQVEKNGTSSVNEESEDANGLKHTVKGNGNKESDFRAVSNSTELISGNQDLLTVDELPQNLDSIKRQNETVRQSEEDFASTIVSNVLEKVTKQLVADNSLGQGDTADLLQARGSIDLYTEQQGDQLKKGTGDHNYRSSLSRVSAEPIVVPSGKDFTATGNYDTLESADQRHNEQSSLQNDRTMIAGKVNPATGVRDYQEMYFMDDAASQVYQANTGDVVGYYPPPHDRLHDDSISQMDKTSILSSGVLEIKIPPAMVNSYCADHLPGVMPQGAYFPGNPQIHYRNLQVSQSYPPPSEPFSSHLSHQQTISPRSTPTQKLMQFPKLRASSTTSGKNFLSSEQRTPSRFSHRQRFPPAIARMSTVMTNTRERTEKQRMMSTYYEERSPSKLLSLDQCINSRPPMPFDLDTPGPCRYTPRNKPLYETNSPKYTFGNKYYERTGGGRTAWSKTWFNSENNYTTKTNFEGRWPSPANHSSFRSQIGRKLPSKMTYPSFSIGVRSKFTINKRGSENEPSPNEYNPQRADHAMYNKAPSFSMTFRHRGTSLWSASEISPAPDLYRPNVSFKPHRPAFTIQGIRRPKNHALGPHATF